MIYKPPESELKLNQLKDFVQQDILNKIEFSNKLVLEAATGFGKTIVGVKLIRKLRETSDLPIVIVVPTNNLKERWYNEVKNIPYVNIYVINTYTMTNKAVTKGELLIIDECHRIANEESKYFSNALKISSFKTILLLSATLEYNHKSLINKYNFDYYEISLYWCNKNNLVPKNNIINIEIPLLDDEKQLLIKYQTNINGYSKFFSKYNIFSPYDIKPNVIKEINNDTKIENRIIQGRVFQWINNINNRKKIYQNAFNKFEILKKLLIDLKDKKIMIFCSSINACDKISLENNTLNCHSKFSNKDNNNTIQSFIKSENQKIVSVGTLLEGVDIPDVSYGIRISYDSSSLKSIQSNGRILRLKNDNQESFMFYFYINDFIFNNIKYESQEKKWLLNNQKELHNIIWTNYNNLNFV